MIGLNDDVRALTLFLQCVYEHLVCDCIRYSSLAGLPTHSRPTTIPQTSVLQTSTRPSGFKSQTSIVLPFATTRELDPASVDVKFGTLMECVTAVEGKACIEDEVYQIEPAIGTG